MEEKLAQLENKYEELCARSEQPDFYADPKQAANYLKEQRELEPVVTAFRHWKQAKANMAEALALMGEEPEMKDFLQSEYQTAKQHTQRGPSVLFCGLIIADDSHIHSKEYGRIREQRKSAHGNLIGFRACLQEKTDKWLGTQGEKHCCQYTTDGSGTEAHPEGSSHTVAVACTMIETDDRLG